MSLSGFSPSGAATAYSYTPTSNGVVSNNISGLGTNFPITAAPYSLTTIVLAGASTPPTPSFALSANPTNMSITQGTAGAATVSVTPSGGFVGDVAFSASGVPAGVTAIFDPPSSATSTTLNLSASPSASAGTSVFTITGTSGGLSSATALALTINAAPSANGPATFAGNATGSPPWYYENGVTLATSGQITALTVTIAVPATNVTYNGAYNTFGGYIAQSYTAGANIVYSFTLGAGQTINPGSGTFAAQMNGNGVLHDVAGDSWTATYTSGGATYTQSGRF